MPGIALLPECARFLAPAPRLPLALPPDEEVIFEFAAAEHGARVAASSTPHVILRLMFRNIEAGDEITLR